MIDLQKSSLDELHEAIDRLKNDDGSTPYGGVKIIQWLEELYKLKILCSYIQKDNLLIEDPYGYILGVSEDLHLSDSEIKTLINYITDNRAYVHNFLTAVFVKNFLNDNPDIAPYLNKPVKITFYNGKVLSGVLILNFECATPSIYIRPFLKSSGQLSKTVRYVGERKALFGDKDRYTIELLEEV